MSLRKRQNNTVTQHVHRFCQKIYSFKSFHVECKANDAVIKRISWAKVQPLSMDEIEQKRQKEREWKQKSRAKQKQKTC